MSLRYINKKENRLGPCIKCHQLVMGWPKTNRKLGIRKTKKIICYTCKKQFCRELKHIRKSSQHNYCSKKCADIGRVTKEVIECAICKKSIYKHKCNIKTNNFCSKKCRGIWFSGKKSPKYKHGGDLTIIRKKHRRVSLKSYNWKQELKNANTKQKKLIDYAVDLKIQVLNLQNLNKEMKNEAKSG